jgi:ribosomal protein S18 acetylase RimI-like enzyme
MRVRLEPMTAAEFDDWLPPMLEDYIADTAAADQLPLATARERAAKQTHDLLPNGVDSADQHLLIARDGDRRVGSLWLRIRDDSGIRRAFVFWISVEESMRGRGYGRAIMLAGEDYARGEGASSMALHVFGRNEVARSLYDKLGYLVTNVSMQKNLA